MWLLVLAIVFPALIVSTILTGLVRRYALTNGIMDIPNGRSSHSMATPRGGGLSIAVVYLGGIILLGVFKVIPSALCLALLGGGLAVAAVGWVDDKRGLSAKQRVGVHFLAAIWAVLMLGGFPKLNLGAIHVQLGLFGGLLAVIGIVWMINLYNFMDGIDGLAAGEAVIVSLVAGLLLLASGHHALAMASFLLTASAGGFLVWNWPPAKIFMGDVSSGLLGFTFATLAVASENAQGLPLLGWALLLSVFVVDATATLIRRVLQGERWYDAHRTHAYQLAVIGGRSHKSVTTAIMLLNVVLAGVGALAWRWTAWLVPALLLGLVGTLYIWWRFAAPNLIGATRSKRLR